MNMSSKKALAIALLREDQSKSASSQDLAAEYKYLVYLLRDIQCLTRGIVVFRSSQDEVSFKIGSKALNLVIRRLTMVALLKPSLLSSMTSMVSSILEVLDLPKEDFEELPLTKSYSLLQLDTQTREFLQSCSANLANPIELFINENPDFFIFNNIIIKLTGI